MLSSLTILLLTPARLCLLGPRFSQAFPQLIGPVIKRVLYGAPVVKLVALAGNLAAGAAVNRRGKTLGRSRCQAIQPQAPRCR